MIGLAIPFLPLCSITFSQGLVEGQHAHVGESVAIVKFSVSNGATTVTLYLCKPVPPQRSTLKGFMVCSCCRRLPFRTLPYPGVKIDLFFVRALRLLPFELSFNMSALGRPPSGSVACMPVFGCDLHAWTGKLFPL